MRPLASCRSAYLALSGAGEAQTAAGDWSGALDYKVIKVPLGVHLRQAEPAGHRQAGRRPQET